MMTTAERLKELRGKKIFIDTISKAFETTPRVSAVDSIEFEVYRKELEDGRTFFAEYLVVNFFGGAKSVRNANGNSNTANFKELGKLIEGGYYEEVRDYETIEDRGFVQVQFSDNLTLDNLLAKPMTHISAVHACFTVCRNFEDVERVIAAVPSSFGSFEAYANEDEDSFTIFHEYNDEDVDLKIDRLDYYFWEVD